MLKYRFKDNNLIKIKWLEKLKLKKRTKRTKKKNKLLTSC